MADTKDCSDTNPIAAAVSVAVNIFLSGLISGMAKSFRNCISFSPAGYAVWINTVNWYPGSFSLLHNATRRPASSFAYSIVITLCIFRMKIASPFSYFMPDRTAIMGGLNEKMGVRWHPYVSGHIPIFYEMFLHFYGESRCGLSAEILFPQDRVLDPVRAIKR
jgi:hypothetical protein